MATYGKPLAGFCLATALFVCGSTGLPVAPGALPPSSGSLSLSSAASGVSTFTSGAHVSLSGSGFAPDAAVTFAIYTSPITLTHAVADASGAVSANVTLPSTLTGSHTLTAIGDGPGNTARVLEAGVDLVPASTLPRTGFDAAAWGLGGIGMLLAGFVLVRTAVFRRRLLPTRP